MSSLVERAFEIAKLELGTKEIPGDQDNPKILEYLGSVNLSHEITLHDEVAWCSSFINWCVQKAGGNGTKSSAARSWLHWGLEVNEPKQGDIVIFKRGSSTWQGHVAFFVSMDDEYIRVLGGNQSNMVKYAYYSKNDLLGFRTSKDRV